MHKDDFLLIYLYQDNNDCQHKNVLWHFCLINMALRDNTDAFLDELTPLSQALIGVTHIGASTMQPDLSAQSFYITIRNKK